MSQFENTYNDKDNKPLAYPLKHQFQTDPRPDLHTVELDLKLIDIRQTGLAQNRLLSVRHG